MARFYQLVPVLTDLLDRVAEESQYAGLTESELATLVTEVSETVTVASGKGRQTLERIMWDAVDRYLGDTESTSDLVAITRAVEGALDPVLARGDLAKFRHAVTNGILRHRGTTAMLSFSLQVKG